MIAKAVCLILIFEIVTSNTGKDTLLSVIQVHRHGERTPIEFYPNDPYQDFSYWGISLGQLTNTGKRQHFELGEYTRRRYKDFLPLRYSREIFYAQSTVLDRTLMSAAANLAGLFPPEGDQIWNRHLPWQPIPIFKIDEAIMSATSTCNKTTTEQNKLFSNNKYFVTLDAKNQGLYRYLTRYSGINVTSLPDAYGIWDPLFIEARQNFRLPKWTEAVFPEPLTSLIGIWFKSFSFTEELKILTAGPFLNAVIEQFEAIRTNRSSTQKYILYSAHDSNNAAILSALGAFYPRPPNFASTLYFEFRERHGINYINLYYKNYGDIEPITIAGCHFDCNWDDFKRIVSNRTITPEQWYVLCDS